MADDPAVAAAPRCQWCSQPLPSASLATCPSCGAKLHGDGDAQLPGVTTLDTDAILRARASAARPRSRLLSFITGDVDDGASSMADVASIAPPSVAVLREMRRLELAAEVANLEAEVQAMTTEAEVEAREAGLIPSDEAIIVPSLSDVLGQAALEPSDSEPASGTPAEEALIVPPASDATVDEVHPTL
jgi:hypothetical protein